MSFPIRVNFGFYGIYRNHTEIIWYIPKPNRILISYRINQSINTVQIEKPYKPNHANRINRTHRVTCCAAAGPVHPSPADAPSLPAARCTGGQGELFFQFFAFCYCFFCIDGYVMNGYMHVQIDGQVCDRWMH